MTGSFTPPPNKPGSSSLRERWRRVTPPSSCTDALGEPPPHSPVCQAASPWSAPVLVRPRARRPLSDLIPLQKSGRRTSGLAGR
ncbi:unnamed protein product [Symbiodinium natans]|uniref:Uncharacterized protein n=1 Tax=Symbiodinium natans TaxID=878477 RepID=A0A812MQ62_9DINO|nr:unnamed protein product [Symbiodinium natans]